jgi:hypothetical protein
VSFVLHPQELAASAKPSLFPKALSAARHHYFWYDFTTKRLRPLAIRFFKTPRPALVEFRFRNPWARFRLIFEGW